MRYLPAQDRWSLPRLRRSSALADLERSRRVAARRRSGFSLIELTIAVLIVGILAGVAAPKYVDWRQRARNAATYQSVKRIADAAETYFLFHGKYPADTKQGVLPKELSDALPASLFTSDNPLGGMYDWNGPGTALECYGVSLFHDKVTPEVLAAWISFDREYDDGNLKTGSVFQSRAGSRNLLIRLSKK